jgi:hypothetical protein
MDQQRGQERRVKVRKHVANRVGLAGVVPRLSLRFLAIPNNPEQQTTNVGQLA